MLAPKGPGLPSSARKANSAALKTPNAGPGFPAYTLVDGRFPGEQLAETLQPFAGQERVLAVTHFQSSGKTRLKLTGVTRAWINDRPLPLEGETAPELSAGEHTLAVELKPAELPALLHVESPEARFLNY